MNITPKGRTKRLDSTDQESLNPHMVSGLASCAKSNSKYRQLTKDLYLDRSDNSQLFKTYSENIGVKQEKNNLRVEDVEMEPEEQPDQRPSWYFNESMIWEIAYLRAFKKWSLASIWAKLNINKMIYKEYLKRFKSRYLMKKKRNIEARSQ